MQVNLNGTQMEELRKLLNGYADGGSLLLTEQGNGSIVVAFDLATFELPAEGEAEEAG